MLPKDNEAFYLNNSSTLILPVTIFRKHCELEMCVVLLQSKCVQFITVSSSLRLNLDTIFVP